MRDLAADAVQGVANLGTSIFLNDDMDVAADCVPRAEGAPRYRS
jgi:hypothetical protein